MMGWHAVRNLLIVALMVIAVLLGLSAKNSVSTSVTHLATELHTESAVDSRAGCRRNIADRHANAESWYGAYVARLAQARLGGPLTKVYYESAADYLTTARSLNSRTNRRNSVTWPLGSGKHPLGYGRLNCDEAFPVRLVSSR